MSQLPMNPLSPERQQKIMGEMYLLMGKQVQSYHKHRHMGNNSSIPVELAQELMASIVYTIDQVGGMYANPDVEEALRQGQEILESKLTKAKSMLELVHGTAPHWQTECRWDALGYLGDYLRHYDHLHLAHKGPEDLFYPILVSPPEGIQGIDNCLFYLNILWVENQIMAGVPDEVLDQLWERLPDATLNQCEQLLINCIGKALITKHLDQVIFEPEEYIELVKAVMGATDEKWQDAEMLICQWLNIKDDGARMYVGAAVKMMGLLRERIYGGGIDRFFL